MNRINQDISTALTRFNVSLKILTEIVEVIKRQNSGKTDWFTFSEQIGIKYITQAKTLHQIFSVDTYDHTTNRKIVDLSSLTLLNRVQLETYGVFYYLFIDGCEIDEKITRFRLWELDGLNTIQRYSHPNDIDIQDKLASQRKEIDDTINIVKENKFFKELSNGKKDYLLKNYTWRFTSESLEHRDKNKWKLSINDMIMRTGLKKSLFEDWYAFTSTHAHTTYWSVVQNNTLTPEDDLIVEYVAIMQSIFINCFLIIDFCKIYDSAKKNFDSLDLKTQEFVRSFDSKGRDQDKTSC